MWKDALNYKAKGKRILDDQEIDGQTETDDSVIVVISLQ
jgi:hypothetical protein